MSESGGKLGKPGATPEAHEAEPEAAYVPPAAANHTAQARFARVGAQRADAAAQISRSLRVWRKADDGAEAGAKGDEGAEAKGDDKEAAEEEKKDGGGGGGGGGGDGGGGLDVGAAASDVAKEDEKGGEKKEGKEGEEEKVKESAPGIGAKLHAKLYLAGDD